MPFTLQGAMMKVAFKEGIRIPPASMENIIMAANNDIRQVSKLNTCELKKCDACQMCS